MYFLFEVPLGDTKLRDISMATEEEKNEKKSTLFTYQSLTEEVEVYGSWDHWKEGTKLKKQLANVL